MYSAAFDLSFLPDSGCILNLPLVTRLRNGHNPAHSCPPSGAVKPKRQDSAMFLNVNITVQITGSIITNNEGILIENIWQEKRVKIAMGCN